MDSSHCVVDSSVFVAFYYAGDPQHEAADRVMRELEECTFIVHPYAIQETATVLTRKGGFEAAKKFLRDVTEAPNVIIPAVDARNDIIAFINAAQKISFTDIALITLARQAGARLITFDDQMLRLFKFK